MLWNTVNGRVVSLGPRSQERDHPSVTPFCLTLPHSGSSNGFLAHAETDAPSTGEKPIQGLNTHLSNGQLTMPASKLSTLQGTARSGDFIYFLFIS